jgi:hypothetical protein
MENCFDVRNTATSVWPKSAARCSGVLPCDTHQDTRAARTHTTDLLVGRNNIRPALDQTVDAPNVPITTRNVEGRVPLIVNLLLVFEVRDERRDVCTIARERKGLQRLDGSGVLECDCRVHLSGSDDGRGRSQETRTVAKLV